MPDLWTHKVAGDIVKKRLGIDFSPDEEKLYNYFLQGPDVFLFTEELNYISWRLHKERPGIFLKCLFERCNNIPLLLGFLSHFDIDRYTHGYIIYLAGDNPKLHEEIEFALDSALSLLFYNMSPTGIDFIRLIPKGFPKGIEDCFLTTYNKVYEESLSQGVFEWSLLGFIKFYTDIRFENRFEDILNTKRRPWRDPYTGKEYRFSFLELMEMANKETVARFKAYLENKVIKIPDVSYYTNRNWREDVRIKYWKGRNV